MALEGNVTREKVLRLCRGRYLSSAQLAELLGKSVNTIRAHYVYPLVREGLLEPKYPGGRKSNQAYRTAQRR